MPSSPSDALALVIDARSRHSATLTELRESPAISAAAEKIASLCFIELPQAQAAVDELQEHADVADDELHAQKVHLQLQGGHYRHTMRLFSLSPLLQEEAERQRQEEEKGYSRAEQGLPRTTI